MSGCSFGTELCVRSCPAYPLYYDITQIVIRLIIKKIRIDGKAQILEITHTKLPINTPRRVIF